MQAIMPQDNQRNKAIFSWIYQIHMADEKVTHAEHQYLLGVALQLGIAEVEALAIIDHPEDYPMDAPTSEYERMKILYYMLFAIEADNRILPEEEHKFIGFGLKLGFKPEMLRDMVDVMKAYLGKSLPETALLDLIRKYAN